MSYRSITIAGLSAAVLLTAPLIALADTGDDIREGLRNPTAGDATRETQIIARTGRDTYGTRQSNLGAGGGAIYGCRSALDPRAIGNPKRSTPCIRVNNLRDGKAFDFQASAGRIIGVMRSGQDLTKARPNVAPFVTNATGLAVGLNADRVDGMHASELIRAARAKAGLDADTIDGLEPAQLVAQVTGAACPENTTAAGGGCIENGPRAAATYAQAASACGAAGRRLVPPDVLLHARTLGGIDLGGGELSADVTAATLALAQGYTTVSDGGDLSVATLGTATAFRCITR